MGTVTVTSTPGTPGHRAAARIEVREGRRGRHPETQGCIINRRLGHQKGQPSDREAAKAMLAPRSFPQPHFPQRQGAPGDVSSDDHTTPKETVAEPGAKSE